MTPQIRPATPSDEDFLWEMLFYAARMDAEGDATPEGARTNPDLAKYVRGWGRDTDLGFVATDRRTSDDLGAAWVRLLTGADRGPGFFDESTPELAIAVRPELLGRGIGGLLLNALLAASKTRFPAVVLNVRADSPACRLYRRAGFEVVEEITNRVGTRSYSMIIRF